MAMPGPEGQEPFFESFHPVLELKHVAPLCLLRARFRMAGLSRSGKKKSRKFLLQYQSSASHQILNHSAPSARAQKMKPKGEPSVTG